jgi:hypothetical protein
LSSTRSCSADRGVQSHEQEGVADDESLSPSRAVRGPISALDTQRKNHSLIERHRTAFPPPNVKRTIVA